MTQLMDYCQDESMLFSDVYHDQVPGMTADFPSPKAFRVGSYSGSDCDRQFQSFPTPPDSPVLAELTTQSGNNRQQQQQQGKPSSSVPGNAPAAEGYRQPKPPTAGYFLGEPNRLASDTATHGMMPSMELDLTLLEDLLHSSSMAEQLGQDFGDSHFQNSLNHPCTETGPKPDFTDNFSQFTPDSPMNMTSSMFPSAFTDAFDDCTIPSPTPSPSPITVADIFAGDLPNLDDLSLVSEFAQMESSALSMSTNPRPFGATSSGEESDIESESSYSLPLDDLQSTFTNMNSQMTPAMLSHPPPPLYHEHHHNIQSYHQFNHHGNHHHSHHPNQSQQQSQTQHPYAQMYGAGMQGASAANGRTHNYQCRTLHTTIKMLDTHADGVVTQDSAPQQQPSCAGPIRKPFRARPRKQSVASSDDGCSDEEHIVTTTTVAGGNGVTSSPNRNRGRGRREAMKGNHLWEFIRDLLKSESYCPKFIRWEDRESGVFRFVNSEAVATMWGRKKNNPQMTYEKLSRAMRYYYKREILERVDGRRLVYKFGKNAEGWREAAGLQ